MNIIKRLKRAAWFSFETLVDAIMERAFGVYSYPPTTPEPDSVRSLRRQYEDTSFSVEIGELRRPQLLEASENEGSNARYRKASIDAPLEPSRQSHLRPVWTDRPGPLLPHQLVRRGREEPDT